MYTKLVTLENIFSAWAEFKKGKGSKQDVVLFEHSLENNLFQLHEDLITKQYKHQGYHTFHLHDPKFRIINKAAVRDRVVHHLVYNYLEPLFQPMFIHQSYSCQKGKGVHKAVNDVARTLLKASKNYTAPVWVLKLDIRKFFASMDHEILFLLLEKKVNDADVLWLLREIIGSFFSTPAPPCEGGADAAATGVVSRRLDNVGQATPVTATAVYAPPSQGGDSLQKSGIGLPIGNLTSQIFANIYLNELDYFAKHTLREHWYFRYADDFIFLHHDRAHLEAVCEQVARFVENWLHLSIHPNKIIYRPFHQGIDWLGYVLLPHYRVLRTRTKQRMFEKMKRKTDWYNHEMLEEYDLNQSTSSYLGILKHCEGYGLGQELQNEIWMCREMGYSEHP